MNTNTTNTFISDKFLTYGDLRRLAYKAAWVPRGSSDEFVALQQSIVDAFDAWTHLIVSEGEYLDPHTGLRI